MLKERGRSFLDSRKEERRKTLDTGKRESILKAVPEYLYGWGRSTRRLFFRGGY